MPIYPEICIWRKYLLPIFDPATTKSKGKEKKACMRAAECASRYENTLRATDATQPQTLTLESFALNEVGLVGKKNPGAR